MFGSDPLISSKPFSRHMIDCGHALGLKLVKFFGAFVAHPRQHPLKDKVHGEPVSKFCGVVDHRESPFVGGVA